MRTAPHTGLSTFSHFVHFVVECLASVLGETEVSSEFTLAEYPTLSLVLVLLPLGAPPNQMRHYHNGRRLWRYALLHSFGFLHASLGGWGAWVGRTEGLALPTKYTPRLTDGRREWRR